MQKIFGYLSYLLLFFLTVPVLAQQKEKITLEFADSLIGAVKNGQETRRLIGNVRLRQGTTTINCDSAYLYNYKNFVEAFGHVRIVQNDSIVITGNNGTYDGQTKFAKMRENVVMNDGKKTLTTEQLDYDMRSNQAYYPNNGTIVEEDNTIVSKQGYYNTQTKVFTFEKDVVMTNPKYKLTSDKVIYDSHTKVAYFTTLTHIEGKDGTLVSTDGEYNTVSGQSVFRSRSSIDYDTYILTGDRLNYDKLNQLGVATGNVILFAKKDSVIVEGDTARYFGQAGISKVYGKALMKKLMKKDTLYITGDTLVSIEDKASNSKKIFAYFNVRIFKKDLQGKCDSLVYNQTDSTIQFYHDPVLWNDKSQLMADTMRIQLVNNAIDKMYLKTNSFVISLDTLKNYNQVKGRQMVAYFDTTSQLYRVTVNGNGENVTWVLNDQNTNIRGVNKVECSNMIINLTEGKVKRVAFLNKPDAVFIPPHEIVEPDTRLRGFKWREKEKPARKDVLVREELPLPVSKKNKKEPAKPKKTTTEKDKPTGKTTSKVS
ncbi:OstA-like protein [Cytophagaceae bacterium YF14B1]|uniref:OstA-like protein n=1 Tax=Xanthocytophaga flava TaxID=3048013 RepID=A0AAE3QH53_9BACT|nr:OstA-like protein [Xanthocytophaga flavus]MDJ1479292.1 OstA-like protein [Xanthocytophaga flavus]